MACQYKYTPPGQTQEIWVTEEELKMFFNGIPPTIKWWEEPGFKARNPNFNPNAYINDIGNIDKNSDNLPKNLQPKLVEEEQPKEKKYSPKVIKKVKEWLHRIDVDIQQLSSKYNGMDGVADRLNNIIQLADESDDVALVEETFHFATDIIQLTNPKLFSQMMNDIGKYSAYQAVRDEYSDNNDYKNPDGSPNIPKLKQEAIGKALSDGYITKLQEHPTLVQKVKDWWKSILEFFGILKKKAGFDPFEQAIDSFEDLAKEGAPVKILAQRIIDNFVEEPAKDGKQHFKNALIDTFKSGDYQAVVKYFYQQLTDKYSENENITPYDATLKQLGGNEELARQIIALGSPYYQLTTEQKAAQKALSDKYDKKILDYGIQKVEGKAEFEDQDDINYYTKTVNGKTTKIRRVTDIVKEGKRADVLAKFENLPAEQKKINKQKAAFGTQLHKDIENIGAAVTKDGYLLPFSEVDLAGITPNLPMPAFQALAKYLIGYNENGEYIPGVFQTQFPEGTLFKFETLVYDEKHDIAGTKDLMGITPDLKIINYDWKSKFLNLQKYTDIPWFSQQDYKVQLGEYNKIDTTYGIKKDDIIKAQAMPIIFGSGINKATGDLVLTSMVLPDANLKNITQRYLLPVPVDNQSSGNEDIDVYIKALNQLHGVLSKQKDLHGAIRKEQLTAISGAIRELQINQEFGPLAEQGLIFLKGAERLLADIKANLKNEDGTYKAIEDKEVLEEYRLKIKNINDNIDKYKNTLALFKAIYGKDDLSPKDAVTIEKLRKLAEDSADVELAIEREYRGFIANYYVNKEDIDLLKISKPIRGLFDRTIQSLSNMQTSALQYLRRMTERANWEKQRKALETQEEYRKVLNPFIKYAESKGLSHREAFTLLAAKNKNGKFANKLLKKINQQFYIEFGEAVKKAVPDVQWIKNNIDLEKWQEEKAKDIERFNKQIDDAIQIIGDEEADNKEKRRLKEDYAARFDISTNTGLGWVRDDLMYYIKDEEKWKTEEYKAVEHIKEIMDMYNFIINFNSFAKQVGYHDANFQFSKTFLPWLRASTIDRIKTSGFSAISDSMKHIYKLTPEEEISYAKVDPNTDEIKRRIPAFFTKNFAPRIEDAEGNLEGYDLKDVSTDIGETIAMYIEAVYEYQTLSGIEGAIQSVRDIEAGKEAFLLDDRGRIVHEGGRPKTVKDNTENTALYDSFVDTIFYKHQYSNQANLPSGTTKLIEKANHWFRLKMFGLNIFTPATILAGGNFQAAINSRKLYRSRQFFSNEIKIIGNLFKGKEGNIEKGIMDYFLPFTENRARLNAERMSLDKIQRFSFSDFLMAPIRKTDILMQMSTSLSMLQNTIVIDGQLVNAREYLLNRPEFKERYTTHAKTGLREIERDFEKRVKELVAEKGVIKLAKFNEKGLLEIEGIDRNSETVHKLRLKMLNEIKLVTGNLSEENKIDADRNILLKSMMMFKRWIPPLAANRFGGLQKKIDTNEYEMGRMRVVWNVIFNGDGGGIKGVLKGIERLRDMVTGNAEGIKALGEYYQKTAESYKNRTGNDLEMTPEEFYDMTRLAITQQAKELGVLLTMLAAFMTLRTAAPPKDDDSENKNIYRMTLKMLDKLKNEISFYYNPMSLQQISTGSWLPSLGILTDGIKFTNNIFKQGVGVMLGDEDMQKSAHPTKTFFQMFPIGGQIIRTWIPLVSPETAKDLGVIVPNTFGINR